MAETFDMARAADVIGGGSGSASAQAAITGLHTILLCDLTDSTRLVEQLGDREAAALLRRHDRAARELLIRHQGREIDKTDGFLLLFARPVRAVAFALDYQRMLRDMSRDTGAALAARIGIHVGELVLWENSPQDIANGAKRHEVEGLAKPVAARLMQLALPGQILLSGVACNLAQRAQDELGARAAGIRWPVHGRYSFKGASTPMLVHEVGEPDIAPLRAPPSGRTGRRALPVWRRPVALALEAAAVLGMVALAIVLTGRPQPAIAFAERDWVVLADLRNLSGDASLDDALDTAFRISLEQSRYVNVLSELKLRDTLARMQRPADQTVDRDVAVEIALREGARAVIVPTIADLGGRIRVSAEIVDPETATTVYAESADAVGVPSALESIDDVTQELRARLGEALQAIGQDSAPLPRITSGDIDALRAYAEGDRALHDFDIEQARASFERALSIDPEFALAHIGLARVLYMLDDEIAARTHADRALALRERLTPRDELYVRAWSASFGPPEPSVTQWNLLRQMYPDHYAAHYNAALFSWWLGDDFETCEAASAQGDVPQNARDADTVYLRATCLFGLGRMDEALREFERAQALGVNAEGVLHAEALAVAGRPDAARERLARGVPDERAAPPTSRLEVLRTRFSMAMDAGDFAAAKAIVDEAAPVAREVGDHARRIWSVYALVLAWADGGWSTADVTRLADAIRDETGHVGAPDDERDQAVAVLLQLGLLAIRSGDVELARQAHRAAAERAANGGYPGHAALEVALRTELMTATGAAEEAIALLDREQGAARYVQVGAARLHAYRASQRDDAARDMARTIADMRARAYSEVVNRYTVRAGNLLALREARSYLQEESGAAP